MPLEYPVSTVEYRQGRVTFLPPLKSGVASVQFRPFWAVEDGVPPQANTAQITVEVVVFEMAIETSDVLASLHTSGLIIPNLKPFDTRRSADGYIRLPIREAFFKVYDHKIKRLALPFVDGERPR
jgi:hypothetical protein